MLGAAAVEAKEFLELIYEDQQVVAARQHRVFDGFGDAQTAVAQRDFQHGFVFRLHRAHRRHDFRNLQRFDQIANRVFARSQHRHAPA